MFAGCGDNDVTREPGSVHAAAVLDPESSSVLVTAWSSVARKVSIEVVAPDDELVFAGAIELDRDAGVASFDVTGLEPATSYRALLAFDSGARLGPHHLRTAPRADDPRPARIAVSADLDPNPEFDSALLEQMAALRPDVFVSLGDFPYTDNGPPAVTVPTYRERHAELRTAPKVRAWLELVGVRAIYDDHEFRNDWDAMFASAERSRYAAAMQVWDEFFPLRGGSAGDIRYRSWRHGANLECFLLDCRRFRNANASVDDASKTMLGDVQRAWLLDGITRSTATFKLVFTSVPLDFGGGNDHWASFVTERARIFDALAGVPGILFVSADQHWFAAHRHARGIREFQVGPLARGLGTPPPPRDGVLFRSSRYNFGLVDVDAETLTFSGIGADGEAFFQESFTPAMLTPSS